MAMTFQFVKGHGQSAKGGIAQNTELRTVIQNYICCYVSGRHLHRVVGLCCALTYRWHLSSKFRQFSILDARARVPPCVSSNVCPLTSELQNERAN
eukprot:1159139-Pelagomonas_calceolata.AAC.6